MKAYTDLEQSKKLAEILPLESADMIWVLANPDLPMIRAIAYEDSEKSKYYEILPAWSLAALIDVISKHSSRLEIILRVDKKYNIFANFDNFIVFRKFVDIDNAIDVCVDMIETLHEQKLL